MSRDTETETPSAEQIVAEANTAIDETVKLFPGAKEYEQTIADRESTLCYLLRSLYLAGMTAEALRQHKKRVANTTEQS